MQYENEPGQFHFLKVPFTFFRDNQIKFDIRATGQKFDLHISAKKEIGWRVKEAKMLILVNMSNNNPSVQNG
ncbi:MAG TPA: hypothetical protein ENK33_00890 [Desulfobacterales bacterium]|nr:hypothetical protein [Desulfobacterales bacterium]